jgi:hypothetical protein
MLASSTGLAQLALTAVTPGRNARGVPTATAIGLTFNAAVDPATVHAKSLRVWGRWSGAMRGAIALRDANRGVVFTPERPFFPGEVVSVMVASAVKAVAGGNLVGGHAWSFWTASAQGSLRFTLAATLKMRIGNENDLMTYGAYAGDLDRDGAPDLSLPHEAVSDLRVVMNDGCGAFSAPRVHPMTAGAAPSTNEGADFDGDGWTDLAVGNIRGRSITVFLNDGKGSYRAPVDYQSGLGTRGLTVLDAEGDGDADVVTANRNTSNLALHKNAGDGSFAPVTFFDGGAQGETAVAAADANGDGFPDLFVGNYDSRSVTLLLNDGAGGFTLSATAGVTGQPWMIATGDIDGDGKADAVTCNSSGNNVAIVRGDGKGGLLTAVHYAVGAYALAIDLGDLDGDGDLDLISSDYSGKSFTGWINDGSGGFTSRFTLTAPAAGSCTLIVDYDRDGDMDIIGIDEEDDVVLLYRQEGPSPMGVQAPSCRATQRVDNLANRGGYGTARPHDVSLTGGLFLGVSGGSRQAWVPLVSLKLEPGPTTPFGILNLDPQWLAVLPPGVTDGFGEALQLLPMPSGLVTGFSFALQSVVLSPTHAAGFELTNPERVVVR